MVRRKNHCGHHNKWCINCCFFTINFFLPAGLIRIGNMDFHFSTLAKHIFCCNFFTIQFVSNLHINRKFFIRFTLIVNIFSGAAPVNVLTILFECLISFDIRDVFQIGNIINGSGCFICTLQPVRYGNLGYRTICCRVDINRFLFFDFFRFYKGAVAHYHTKTKHSTHCTL